MIFAKTSDPDERTRRRSRIVLFIGIAAGILLATDLSFAASTWTIGVNPNSSGEAASGTVSNLTISAVASPSPANLLYPGSQGDVVLTISNPNPYPVTVTALQFPTNVLGANGYSNSDLDTASLSLTCTAATSGVTWTYSTSVPNSSHSLTTPIVVAASGATGNPLTVTLDDYASMATTSPATCENTFFQMPSLGGVTATAGGSPVTASPAADG